MKARRDIVFVCLWFGVLAVSSGLVLHQDAHGNNSNSNTFYESDVTEELTLDDCDELGNTGIVKTLITSADVVQSCSSTITSALDSSNGAVIIIGTDRTAIAFACMKLDTQNELFFNKYYDLPQSVKTLSNYIDGELKVKVYTTSRQSMIDKLRELILNSKYDDAVELSAYLHSSHPKDGDRIGKKIIISVVNEILKDNLGYQIMNYAFKLFQNNEKIIEECFPGIFMRILSDRTMKILNKEKTGALRLSTGTDSYDDRWLNIDCYNPRSSSDDIYWRFSPVWSAALNGVVFLIQNPVYGMKLKLDVNPVRYDERLAWGDHRQSDARFKWRLMPVGFNEREEILFRLDDTVYSSCLSLGSCYQSPSDVTGSKGSCTTKNGWIFETGNTSDLHKKLVQFPDTSEDLTVRTAAA